MRKLHLFALSLISATILLGQEVIFELPPDGGTAVMSNYYIPGEGGVYSADDFDVEVASNITEIEIYGYQGAYNLDEAILDFNIYVYADNNGEPAGNPASPGTEIWKLNVAPGDAGFTYEVNDIYFHNYTLTFNIDEASDEPLILEEGRYWLVPVASLLSLITDDPDLWWQWRTCDSETFGSKPKVYDDGIYGFGDVWWDWNDVGGAGFVNAMTFKISGSPLMNTIDTQITGLKIYPNPAKDLVRISTPENAKIKSVEIISTMGQSLKTSLQDNTLNISHLPKGVYILKVSTTKGIWTEKLIKN